MSMFSAERSPGAKLGWAILIGFLLSFPLFTVWLLVYDRQQQSQVALASIAEGWGGPQVIGGPLLVIPYRSTVSETVTEGAQQVTRSRVVWQELTLAPELSDLTTEVRPERRKRSIYEAVVYEASVSGKARFAMPQDLARFNVAPADMDLARAELRFHLSDPRGLGANPRVVVAGRPLRLNPGGGGAAGFFAWIDAASLGTRPLEVDYAYSFRGNGSLGLAPQAGDTRWRLRSQWPHPSFQGDFLPAQRQVGADGFEALYRVGNLALGQQLVGTAPAGSPPPPPPRVLSDYDMGRPMASAGHVAQVSLVQPVDLYSRVNRSAKYGFLFIGFTPAYILASAAITGLNTAYSAAVLKSWRRAFFIGALLASLYAVLFILLSLEAYSLLIGSLMLFTALAAVMYLTRNLNWGARNRAEEEATA